jgi:hypothetical protein
MAGQCLVDRVVDHFVDHVVQAGAVIGVADIHAGPLAHGVKALEDLDRFRAVFGRAAGLIFGRVAHGIPLFFCRWKDALPPPRITRRWTGEI